MKKVQGTISLLFRFWHYVGHAAIYLIIHDTDL